MNYPQKKDIIWFLSILAVGTALWVELSFFFGDTTAGSRRSSDMRPDAIATSTTSLGNIAIENRTGGYALAVPSDWRLENSSGSGLAVYVAGHVMEGVCKIEIAELQNPYRQDLSMWLEGYLRADPTTEVTELSRDEIVIAGSRAIIWAGALNGVSSTLAYIATGTSVYEVAPSVVAASGTGGPVADACGDALGKILTTFQWLP